tara:strand:- start:1680 stop:1952 length:273 start_codon:yes stop_codon:yes gene_type:complete
MKQQQLIEIIKQHHPKMPETQIRLYLNAALKEFCRKTRILKSTATTNTAVDQRYYALSSIDTKISDVIRVDYNGYEIPRLVGTIEKSDLT